MNVKKLNRQGDWIEDEDGRVIERQWDFGDGKCKISQYQYNKEIKIAERVLYINKFGEIYHQFTCDWRNFWQKITIKLKFQEPHKL